MQEYLKHLKTVYEPRPGRCLLQHFKCINIIKTHNGIMFNSTQHCYHKIYHVLSNCWPSSYVNNDTSEKYGEWGYINLTFTHTLAQKPEEVGQKKIKYWNWSKKIYYYCVTLFSTIISCIIVKVRSNRELEPFHIRGSPGDKIWISLCCVFQVHHWVWCAIALNFC